MEAKREIQKRDKKKVSEIKNNSRDDREKASPKDVFTHLLVIIMLYASAISFLVLVFQIINVRVSDALSVNVYYNPLESIFSLLRGAIAFLVTVYPVYILASWMLNKSYAQQPSKRDLRIRKWLVYFTLFVTALIIVGNLVVLLMGFLRGELTMRFFLKVLAVFFVAGSIFGYYLLDLRKAEKNMLRWFFAGVTLVVLAAVGCAFWIIGSPKEQRLRRFDEQRIQALQSIEYNINAYWQANKKLPENLSVLSRSVYGTNLPVDPETEKAYEYEAQSSDDYVLCATFSATSLTGASSTRVKSVPALYVETWEHNAGRVCFERTVEGLEALPAKY